ncbi:hypothetical protein CEXT_611251 [Caerostris extrusa]|uniref:Uncharacterized protein n=1 Tax=Caerostris extrusa TaxID=172846 RepID=A0AAV4MH52_CAEEX|nr:hypothetical protein CEXT_611251 [Caerostris extrusa]
MSIIAVPPVVLSEDEFNYCPFNFERHDDPSSYAHDHLKSKSTALIHLKHLEDLQISLVGIKMHILSQLKIKIGMVTLLCSSLLAIPCTIVLRAWIGMFGKEKMTELVMEETIRIPNSIRLFRYGNDDASYEKDGS